MHRLMRMLVFFDLPVKTAPQRRVATQFCNFLLKDGYHMLQYSLYARVCCGTDAVDTHRARLYAHLPPDGSVRLLVITEKQYAAVEILVGRLTPQEEPDFPCEQLSIF